MIKPAEFERTILNLSQNFINMPLEKLDAAIISALGKIGEYCDVDQSSIWRYDWANETLTLLYEWNKDSSKYSKRMFSNISIQSVAEAAACHKLGIPYHIRGLDGLLEGDQYLGNFVESRFESTSSFPLLLEGKAIGVYVQSSMMQKKKIDDTENSIVVIFCQMVTNVLMRKEREVAMLHLNEINKLILNSTNDGIAMFGRDGIILGINNVFAERLGTSIDEIIGRDFKVFLQDELHDDLYLQRLDRIRRVFDTGEPEMLEGARNGRIFHNRFYPVLKDGNVSAVSLFSTDITYQKRAIEAATEGAEYHARLSVITDFFTNISHELRTPLSILLMAIDMIDINIRSIEFERKDKVAKSLIIMRQNAQRLLRLVGNLLDVTKLDAGFMTVWLQDTDVSLWLRKLIDSVEEFAGHKGISVSFNDDAEIQSMPIDGDKLDRIMLNLLSNAIKHARKGGHIKVTLSDSVDKILIAVADDGEGIPDDKKHIIFDRFKQVETSLARSNEGSGIGLALTKAMVELLQGKIWFESKQGEGCVFYVELPVIHISEDRILPKVDGLPLNRKVEMEFSDIS